MNRIPRPNIRYSREAGFGLMAVALLCVVVSAPPWMFMITGLAAIGFGFLGLRQRREDVDASDRSDDATDGVP